jgi:hypothetical protein
VPRCIVRRSWIKEACDVLMRHGKLMHPVVAAIILREFDVYVE